MCCSYIQLKLKPFCLRSQLCSQWMHLVNQRQNLNQRHRSDSEPRCMPMMHITKNSKRAVMRELKLYTESGSGRGMSNGIWDGQLAVHKSKIINCCFGGRHFVWANQISLRALMAVILFCVSGFHVTDASICVMLLSISACGILPFDACSQM